MIITTTTIAVKRTRVVRDATVNETVGENKNSNPAVAKTREETLSEQLAKITPQILAAISVAAKSTARNKSMAVARTCYYVEPVSHDEDQPDTSLRLDEVMDPKKLALIFSTSPTRKEFSTAAPADTTNSSSLNNRKQTRRVVPIDAFRRTRRNSLPPRNVSNAFRQNSQSNCMLAAVNCPNLDDLGFQIESIHFEVEPDSRKDEEKTSCDVTIEIEVGQADDENEGLSEEFESFFDADLFTTNNFVMPNLFQY